MRARFTLPAIFDLEAILDYIAASNPDGALRVQQRIERTIALALIHPHAGPRTEDPSIRRLVASPYPYLIFYQATDEEIIVHAIRHARRKPYSRAPGH